MSVLNTFKDALATIKEQGFAKDPVFAETALESSQDVKVYSKELSASLMASGYEADSVDDVVLEAATRAAGVIGGDTSSLYANLGQSEDNGFGESFASDEKFSIEQFDDRVIDVFQAATFTFNLEAAVQDPFSEAFFPTVIGDITTGGVKLNVRSTYINNEFVRKDANPDSKKVGRKPLLATLNDANGPFGQDKLALLPVVGGAYDGLLELGTQKAVVYPATGETINTASYKLGERCNVLAAAQSANLIAKGVMDETDALDAHLPMKNLYFDAAGQFVAIDISNLPGAAFFGGRRGDAKDLVLNVNTSMVVDMAGMTDIAGAAVATGSTAKAIVDVIVYGTGNATDGELSVSVGEFKFAGAVDANGVELAAGNAQYDAAKTFVDALAPKSWDADLRVTNSNLRRKGILLSPATRTESLFLKAQTPIFTEAPLQGQLTSGEFVSDLLAASGVLSNFSAVSTLIGFARYMTSQAGVPADKVNTGTVGEVLINPYFQTTALDLTKYVDSLESAKRRADLKASIIDTIASDVAQMLAVSGYANVQHYVTRQKTTEIVIGTYPELAAFLGSESIDLGNGCVATVVSTNNTDMRGKMYVTIGSSNSSKTQVELDSFGKRLFVPALVSQVTTNIKKVVVNNVFSHTVVLPMLCEYNVSGLDKVLAKVAQLNRI